MDSKIIDKDSLGQELTMLKIICNLPNSSKNTLLYLSLKITE